MYSLTQESSDQYSQELMDIAATYPDHYSSEEESSDVELIEEGSMGRYSTFSNLSTAKEKKTAENKDPSAANGLVSGMEPLQKVPEFYKMSKMHRGRALKQ